MIISVASGKGGTGKTTFSLLFAKAIAPALYVDADVEEPNGSIFLKPEIEKEEDFTEPVPKIIPEKCTYCGDCARACPYKALVIIPPPAKKDLFFPELCHSCGVCAYVCPEEGALIEVPKKKGLIRTGRAGELDFMEGILNIGEPTAVPLIKKLMKKVREYPGDVIVDAPPGTSCPVVEATQDADFVILVAEPTPFGVHDLSLVVDMIRQLEKKFAIVVNKAQEGNRLVEDYAEKEGIPVLLRLPFSENLARMYSRGELPFGEFKEQLRELRWKIEEISK